MVVFAIVTPVFWIAHRRLLAFMIGCLGLAVGWARIFLGIHFPFDMLGAMGVAAVICMIGESFWFIYGQRLADLVERSYQSLLARII